MGSRLSMRKFSRFTSIKWSKPRKPKELFIKSIGWWFIPTEMNITEARRLHEWLGRFIAWKEGQK